jgi:Phage tail protein
VLTQVDVTNPRSDTLALSLLDASNGYVVKDIQGLDPVNAALTTSSMAQRDGAQDQNARRDTRNVTIKLGLEPDYLVSTVDSLRTALYNWFMSKSLVDMAFYKDDVLFAVASGRVESCENNMFSTDPEVDISIICYDPDFYGPAAVTSNSGTVSTTDTTTINYEGTSDAGVIFTLNVDRTLSDFTLYNTSPDNTLQQFIVSGSFVSGDVITIVSIPGQKRLTLTRSGIETSVLFWMDTSSSWITLQKGANHFRAFASGASVPFTLSYTPQYGGI